MSNSKLATEKYPAYSGNYTKGRNTKITEICIHHMAGVLTAKQCGAIFQKVGRKGSSNYGVGKNGEIAVYVDEKDTAWCNSNWNSNCRSVSIETSNSKNGDNWPVSDKVLESLIELVADIAKRNNMGKLVKGKNVTWHSFYANTQCPGPYLLSKMDYIVNKANEINQGKGELKITEIEKKKVVLNTDANLWDLTFESYSDAKYVKKYDQGDVIDNIVAIAEHPLGSKYYMTEYSYKNNIKNGFNVVDCNDYIENALKNENTVQNEVPKVEECPIIDKNEDSDDKDINVSTKEETDTNVGDYEDNKEQNNPLLYIIDLIINFIKKIFGGK